MSGFWQVTGTTTVTINNGGFSSSNPTGVAAAGQQVRLRALEVIGAATSAALTITDAVGSTVVWSETLPASGTLQLTNLDIRTSGNMTVAQTGAISINCQGDFVVSGYPWGLT